MSTLLVVGGVAAGMSAASKAKRLDPSLNVIALENHLMSRTARVECLTTCCAQTIRWKVWWLLHPSSLVQNVVSTPN